MLVRMNGGGLGRAIVAVGEGNARSGGDGAGDGGGGRERLVGWVEEGGILTGVEGMAVREIERKIRLWDQRRVVGWLNGRSEECVCFGYSNLLEV